MMKKYLVIGNTIEHSLSPKLHNYWIKKNNIDAIYKKKKFNKKINYTASVLNCGIDSFANSNAPNRIPTYIKSPTIAFCKKGSPAV